MTQGATTARERALQRAVEAAGGLPPLKTPEIRPEPTQPEGIKTLDQIRAHDIIKFKTGRIGVIVGKSQPHGWQLTYRKFTDKSRTRLSVTELIYYAQPREVFTLIGRSDKTFTQFTLTRSTNQQEGSQMATVTRSKSKTAAKSTAKGKTAPKAKTNGDGEAKTGSGRPRVTFTRAQLEKSAKMKRDGKTWNQIREALGVKTSSGQFQKLWDEAGIERPATRERSAPGEGKAAKSDADDKGTKAAEARKGSGKKVTRRASKANPSK